MTDHKFVPVIRIFRELDDGTLDDTRDEYDVGQLAGTVPNVGDIIVSPWASKKANRQDPTQRKFLEVVSRYFSPQHPRDGDKETLAYVILVVRSRPGTWKEAGVYNN